MPWGCSITTQEPSWTCGLEGGAFHAFYRWGQHPSGALCTLGLLISIPRRGPLHPAEWYKPAGWSLSSSFQQSFCGWGHRRGMASRAATNRALIGEFCHHAKSPRRVTLCSVTTVQQASGMRSQRAGCPSRTFGISMVLIIMAAGSFCKAGSAVAWAEAANH